MRQIQSRITVLRTGEQGNTYFNRQKQDSPGIHAHHNQTRIKTGGFIQNTINCVVSALTFVTMTMIGGCVMIAKTNDGGEFQDNPVSSAFAEMKC
jgi:hypothetical protein